jgi:cyclopropane fatty-acyl-phospholipid synthase-like methyltransferase
LPGRLIIMGSQKRDPWLKRRIMRLTALEKRAVNSSEHAKRTVSTALGILENVRLPERPKCLELGCGQGALARLMVERFQARMTATDFDPAQVRLAESRLRDLGERIVFRTVDARDLPFGDGEFDVVFSFGVLHHIAGGWRRVVSEVSRVLTPTGLFVFTDLYLPHWFMWILGKLFPRFDQLAFGPLREVLETNGLDITYQMWERHMGGFLAYGKTVASKS